MRLTRPALLLLLLTGLLLFFALGNHHLQGSTKGQWGMCRGESIEGQSCTERESGQRFFHVRGGRGRRYD